MSGMNVLMMPEQCFIDMNIVRGMNEQFNHGRGDEKAGVRILQSLPGGALSSQSTACVKNGFIKRVFKPGSIKRARLNTEMCH